MSLACLAFLGIGTNNGTAFAATPQESFVQAVRKIVGKKTKGWQQSSQILSRGASICAGLAENGYSQISVRYQAGELTSRSFAKFPIRGTQAAQVTALALEYLCPMPTVPPALSLPADWIGGPNSIDSTGFTSTYKYSGAVSYGQTISIGNMAQVPSKAAVITEINCTGEWYAKQAFDFELVDAAGNLLVSASGGKDPITSNCATFEIRDVGRFPTATGIRVPSVTGLDGFNLSGPGVSMLIYFTAVAPADYCDPRTTFALSCRSHVGPVYFPPAA